MIATSHHWKKTAIAAAATALLTLSGTSAWALSLGRITVFSALGEPLRAEIEVPEINAEESASLRTKVAQPEAFTAAGLEYNPAMSTLQASLQRRADGRAYIRLSSDRPINDPFVDMILEASWSSGRIVRDYTMLFDPPSMRKPAPVTPTLAQVQPAPAPAKVTPIAEAPRAPAAVASSAPVTTKPAAAPAATSASETRVTVKTGDTASLIAGRIKGNDVSLDQMLVAMLRSNPDAFINSNINRIRAGAVISVPTSAQASAVAAPEASRILYAQSQDFNAFRRALASSAPATTVAAADRKAGGTVESKVVETKPTAATPDKLTLSKGAIEAKAKEEKIAKERADKEAAARAAELAKNISDLKKAGAAVAAASAPATAAPAVKASAAVTAVTIPVPVEKTPSVTPAPMPAPAASPVKPAASSPKAAPVAPVVEEPGLLAGLMDDPLIPLGGAAGLALLAGGAFFIRQRKKKGAQVDSSFLESRLQPDSFFGASGGQRVDTNNEGPVSGSSMVYSASQLDAADDVDPVAEADVYLAYGRDMQAEEILKEALRTSPGRLAIHTKLLEIYAKRRDTENFETSAHQAFKLTGVQSAEWTRICEMGLGIDPSNTLYQPGGSAAMPIMDDDGPGSEARSSFGASTAPQSISAEMPSAAPSVDLDLDLDFSLDDEPASAISDVTGGTVNADSINETIKMQSAEPDALGGLDFDVSAPATLESTPELPEISLSMGGVSLTSADAATLPEFDATNTMSIEPSTAATPINNEGMLEFDMDSLSLDLEPSTKEEPAPAPDTTGEDPLETKLALAEEFISIGDEDGARALIEEVVAEASGDMRIKAQRALANLS